MADALYIARLRAIKNANPKRIFGQAYNVAVKGDKVFLAKRRHTTTQTGTDTGSN